MVQENAAGAAAAALREALAAWRRGDKEAALAHCGEALARDSALGAAWTLSGIILRSADPVNAEVALRRALAIDPRNADALFHLGNLHREQRQFAAAVEAYEQALALAPAHPSLLNNLGLAQEDAGELKQAERAYRKVLERDPEHRQALRNLAHLLCRMRIYDEARTLCAAYLQRWGADDVDVLVDQGICLHQARDYAGAETSFRQALALATDDPLILTNLGSLFIDDAEYERAEAVLARLVQLVPATLRQAALDRGRRRRAGRRATALARAMDARLQAEPRACRRAALAGRAGFGLRRVRSRCTCG